MAKALFKNGVTGVITRVFLQDTASAIGAGKTGLGIASAGLNISQIADNEASATTYTAAGSTIETITTLGTFAAPTATKCRFKEVDATNLPGIYEIQIADARWAVSSARSAIVCIQATGVAVRALEVQLTVFDLNASVTQTGDAFARIGAAGAGLTAIGDTRVANLDATISSRTKPADTQARVTLVDTATTLTNAPSDSSGVTTLLSRLSALRAGYLDNLSAGAAALESSLQGLITTVGAAGAGLTAAVTAVWSVATRVLTAGTNIVLAKGTGVTGFNDIAAGAAMTLTGAYEAAKTAAQASDIPSATITAGLSAAASAASSAASAATNAALLQARVPASPAAVSDIAALFTTAMAESYNTDGGAPTPAQALFVIMQRLTEFAIVGTTLTAKKLDGSTTAFTLTFDDATAPTSSTRAT